MTAPSEAGDGADPGEARVVLITAPDEDAGATLARALVERRLAACVNLVPRVRSIYRWEGEVQDDGESLLVVKTRATRLAALESALAELHPYDVPECVALAPARVEAKYLAWLVGEVAD